MPKTNLEPVNIYTAARNCDPAKVKTFIDENADLSKVDEHGFTALQCAAVGSNSCTDESRLMDTLKFLVEAGSPLEVQSKDVRTALFLLAEFSPYVSAVQYLIDAGANPNVFDSHGNHITVNAMMEEVQQLLSEVTGVALPPEPEPEPEPVKMSAAAWKKAKASLGLVFDELNATGLIALQDAGYTQSDGFADCSELFHEHPNQASIEGFCFYTRQDLNTAKRSSLLYLGVWGAPAGADEHIVKVGSYIIWVFEKHGFEARWNGLAATRPCVTLYRFND